MDPNETLAEMRRLVSEIAEAMSDAYEAEPLARAARHYERADTLRANLADTFVALDEWLTNGGFPPAAWMNGRP